MAPNRSRKPIVTIQKKESRQPGPGGRAMAGAEAADCEVSVLTAIVGKVPLFSHDVTTTTLRGPQLLFWVFHYKRSRGLAGLCILLRQ